MNLDFTFLKEDQIWGDDALDVMKRYGVRVAPTDLTAILGGSIASDLSVRFYWTTSSDENGGTCCVTCFEDKCFGDYGDNGGIRTVSARPALSPKEASKVKPDREWTDDKGIRHCEFGEYPQTVADDGTCERLEKLYNFEESSERLQDLGTISPTGKYYTFDSVDLYSRDTPFRPAAYPEYEMDGKKYIRVLGRPSGDNHSLFTEKGKPYWIEVQPIEWLVDPSGTMVAKNCLFAGIQFDTKEKYDGDFSKTFMKYFLDTYFAKEMLPLERTDERENVTEKTDDTATKKVKDLKMKMLRAIAAENVSPQKGVINRKRSDLEKDVIKAVLGNVSKGIGK